LRQILVALALVALPQQVITQEAAAVLLKAPELKEQVDMAAVEMLALQAGTTQEQQERLQAVVAVGLVTTKQDMPQVEMAAPASSSSK
jgi:hypothetical protein